MTTRKKPVLKNLKPAPEQLAEYSEQLAIEMHKAVEAAKRVGNKTSPERLVEDVVNNTVMVAVRDCLGIDDTWETLEINRGPVRDLVEKFINSKLPQIEARVDAELEKMWKARGAQIMKAASRDYIEHFEHAVSQGLKYAAQRNALKEVNAFLVAQGLDELNERDLNE